MSAMR